MTSEYRIERAAVIGAGTMGLGIAGQLANAGVDVLLLDIPADGPNRNAIGERAISRLLDEKQPGLLHKDNVKRIRIGNVEDDLHLLSDIDWIAEAVVEKLEIKRDLYRRIDAVRKPGSIVSSNTSTIPIALLVAGMPGEFRAEFAITHFFNPVRYMQLLELVRGADTRPEVMDCLAAFNDEQMGKGIVICNDTPGFLGNRVGVFAIQTALHAALNMGLTAEEADAVFGRPMGIPKTGVFGLYDLIGIDLMSDVGSSLDSILPPGDSFHRVAKPVPLMQRMIGEGYLGNKGLKGGFYRQGKSAGGPDRETLDFERFAYRPFDAGKLQTAVAADLVRLLQQEDKYGRYAWEVLAETLCYAATLVPEVNELLLAIDDAMKLGYNWVQGPFEMIDAIGVDRFVERLTREGRSIPEFLKTAAGRSFYRVHREKLQYLLASGKYIGLARAPGVVRFSEERRRLTPLLENRAASYFRIADDIGLVEFHSKANTLDGESMRLLADAVAHASENYCGLIIHNDAQHFSCGVNLAGVRNYIVAGDWAGLDGFLQHFQQTVLSMKYAPIPVVAAPSGLSLGGGFEVVLHTDKVIFHANSVTGLVETLVGVVPGGGGVKEMLYRWFERKGDMREASWAAFMNIAYGKTARSPLEAEPLAMFRSGIDSWIMNRDRLLATAIEATRVLARDYSVVQRMPLAMPGQELLREMVGWLEKAHAQGRLTAHDVTTGTQIATIASGGDVKAGTLLGEMDLCALERQAFGRLARTAETKARIEHMLERGTPLRN